ncbi:MAG: hypothetical protein KC917_17835 [Candidatus Omnitrophica bacterium]|nr:hypothetical protein [Candidatus Omnitrophota bacterium]MCB9782315.1 hypothetical protein [Candidatus Omnitrophota bacterium]
MVVARGIMGRVGGLGIHIIGVMMMAPMRMVVCIRVEVVMAMAPLCSNHADRMMIDKDMQ